MANATFACTGALPTTASCTSETARACPAGNDASTADSRVPAEAGPPPPSGVCAGLCEAGLAATFACKDSYGYTATFSLTVGNDGTTDKAPACVESNGIVYRCDQTLFQHGQQIRSWARSGAAMNAALAPCFGRGGGGAPGRWRVGSVRVAGDERAEEQRAGAMHDYRLALTCSCLCRPTP